jgi:hypothetical protein
VSSLVITILGQTLDVRDYSSALLEVFGGTLVIALIIGFLYGRGREKRAWCRHACPIGLLLGVFLRLGAVDRVPKRPASGIELFAAPLAGTAMALKVTCLALAIGWGTWLSWRILASLRIHALPRALALPPDFCSRSCAIQFRDHLIVILAGIFTAATRKDFLACTRDPYFATLLIAETFVTFLARVKSPF